MSNGTKPLNKNFKIEPKFPSVTVQFNGKEINVSYRNANWEIAVNLLVDGLQIARNQETNERRKDKPSIVTPPGGLYVPRGS